MQILSISAAAFLGWSAVASVSAQSVTSSSALPQLQHRHSFFSTLPVEPSDDNLKVARHQVQVVGLSGFREWEVKGSFRGLYSAAGKISAAADRALDSHGKVHVQWHSSNASLLRPPFTPTFIPGLHLAVTSNDFAATWEAYCPVLAEVTGAVDCRILEELQLEDQSTKLINAQHLITINNHHYVHRTTEPPGFMSSSSILSTLVAAQQSGTRGPALIDLVLENGNGNLKVVWSVGNQGQDDEENTVKVTFDKQTDKVVEVGWFYRELTEREHTVFDHYLGATVKMDAEGEVVSEALIQTRSPVFPPHKKEIATGNIRIPGHGYSSTMSPAQTFHPHSITTIHSNPYIAETTGECDLYVLQVLPPGIFVDPFQLEGLAPEIGESTVFGETDLEKPVGVVPGWGSLVLVKVQPEESVKTSRWIAGNATTETTADSQGSGKPSPYISTVDVPMHMRYQPPVSEQDPATHVDVAIPWPIVAWTCPASGNEESAVAAAKKLFYIPPLPLNLLFKEDTVNFRFLLPDPIPKHYPESHVSVPVGRLEDLEVVRTVTFVLAGAGTLAVAWALIKAVAGRSSGKGKQD
ncbi:protease B nonderepressible form [Dissophora globulifera]|nr:protease B nonderepressible form [Dissophora globulifera]